MGKQKIELGLELEYFNGKIWYKRIVDEITMKLFKNTYISDTSSFRQIKNNIEIEDLRVGNIVKDEYGNIFSIMEINTNHAICTRIPSAKDIFSIRYENLFGVEISYAELTKHGIDASMVKVNRNGFDIQLDDDNYIDVKYLHDVQNLNYCIKKYSLKNQQF